MPCRPPRTLCRPVSTCTLTFPLPQSVSAEPSIFVSNITDASIDTLIHRFSGFGQVLDAYFVTGCRSSPPTSGESKGSLIPDATKSAIIKFENWTAAERAYTHFSTGSTSETLSVRYARPRGDALPGDAISARRLFVGQLPPDISKEDVTAYFAPFGDIVDVSLSKNKLNTQPSCAFVEYSTWAACDKAIEAGNGQGVFGDRKLTKPVVVKYSQSKFYSLGPGHGYTGVGSLHELVASGPWPHMSHMAHVREAPTNGYIMNQPMPFAVAAFWPLSVAQDGSQQVVHCPPGLPGLPCYPQYPEYPYVVPMPAHSGHAAHAALIYRPTGGDADSRKIFVGQLPRAVTEEELVSLFAVFGPIENVTVLRAGARCGFVTFCSRSHALNAVDQMHGAEPYGDGRQLVVRLASSRRQPHEEQGGEVGGHGSPAVDDPP